LSPRAVDEDVYNRKIEMRDVGTPDRYLDKTARTREINYRHVDYMARFDQKYADLNGKLDRFDGNPFT